MNLAELLSEHWGLADAEVEPLVGGMNSETWQVRWRSECYIAKQVAPSDFHDFEVGCRHAAFLSDAGFATGRPVPTTDGDLVLTAERLALLDQVRGVELDGESADEQVWIAKTLAGVHRASPMSAQPTANFATDWLEPADAAEYPWLVDQIEAVRTETDHLTLTWCMLHADPTPEAFLHDETTGVTGLIDWGGARPGPVLYDIASAVMYLGGPAHADTFLASYTQSNPLPASELAHLDTFRRLRWAVQGVYFAQRLAANDLTGIEDRSGNEKGLADARRGLAEWE